MVSNTKNDEQIFKSEFLLAAKQILEKKKRPMGPKELVSEAIKHGLFSDKRIGKTPHQTMKSKLCLYIRKNEQNSIFIRTEPGKFYLRYLLEENATVYNAPPLVLPKSYEKVLVFDTRWFTEKTRFQGIKKIYNNTLESFFKTADFSYLNRFEAENCTTYKQVLTYVLVTREGKVLCYKRGNYSRIEDYLRGSYCVGFGGHVNQTDNNLFTTSDFGITECAKRELAEELKLPLTDYNRLQLNEGLSLIGILNDDSSEVGQKHFAFIYRYEVSNEPYWDKPQKGEKAVTQLQWISEEVIPSSWNFEYWSQLCLREYFPQLVKTAPAYRINRRLRLKPPNVICIIGNVGSGKSETTKLLCEEYGYIEINTGKIIASLLGIPPIPETPREIFQKVAFEFITKPRGSERLAEAIFQSILNKGPGLILIDGIRQNETYLKLQEYVGKKNIGLLYVYTVPDIAYKLYKEREKVNISIFDFLNIRNAPVEKEVEDMIGISDVILYNWLGLEWYRQSVRNLMNELLEKSNKE